MYIFIYMCVYDVVVVVVQVQVTTCRSVQVAKVATLHSHVVVLLLVASS